MSTDIWDPRLDPLENLFMLCRRRYRVFLIFSKGGNQPVGGPHKHVIFQYHFEYLARHFL